MNLILGDVEAPDGWICVDLRDGADVQADVRHLPHEDNSVDEIMAEDLLEHFPADQTQEVLAEWRRVLKPGGKLTVKVPNLEMLSRWVANGHKVQAAIRNIYGGHRWGPEGSWDAHHTGWTPDLLHIELEQAGFRVIRTDQELNMRFTVVKV